MIDSRITAQGTEENHSKLGGTVNLTKEMC